MPPILAAILYVGFVIYLFRRDFREQPNVTSALWIPFLWVFIAGSRFISGWLAIVGLNVGAVSVEEGSPVDAFVFLILILSGLHVLRQRRVRLAEFFRDNRLVAIYLVYCLLAISWSDFPFVGFKRWIKLFGQPIMVMVVLTEPDPMEAVTRLFKRCAFVILPISVLFIKYYPQYGRAFDGWSGLPSNTGITTNKNALGCDCFILGLFYAWHFRRVWPIERGRERTTELGICVLFFVMIGWLVHIAQSQTALSALLLSLAVYFLLGTRYVDARRLGSYVIFIVIFISLGNAVFGLQDLVFKILGRNQTFTGRTEIWNILLHWQFNPIIGVGFESFWLGPRVQQIEAFVPGLPLNEAHNGYLETYINLGVVGLSITLVMLLATYLKGQRALLQDYEFGRLRLAYLAAFIVYNWTEAAFRTHSLPFFMFFLIAIDYRARQAVAQPAVPEPAPEVGLEGACSI